MIQRGYTTGNLNDILSMGVYHCASTCANLPSSNSGILKVYKPVQETTMVTQQIDMFDKTTYLGTYLRNRCGGVWSSWHKLAFTEIPRLMLINSGFYQHWSGEIRCYRNQEGLVSLTMNLTRDSDIISDFEIIYTLPYGIRPNIFEFQGLTKLINMFNTSENSIANSFANICVKPTGEIAIWPVAGTVRANARKIFLQDVNFYTDWRG